MAVVKANAYGHGLCEVGALALTSGADALCVAIAEEGIALREAGIAGDILVLGGANPTAARAAVEYDLAQALYDPETLRIMQEEAARRGVTAKVHLKIDTGMTRIGIMTDAGLEEMLEALRRSPNIALEGIFTHFADPVGDPEFTREQDRRFMRAVERVRAAGYDPIVHAAASAAALSDEALWHDMVRIGIALYGAEVCDLCPELTPAQSVVLKPFRIERVFQGTTVGYGRTFRADRETVIMTLPIGYADGYPRLLTGKAFALVKGRRAPLCGRVCMDMLMVDVTDIPGVTMDDEVVLLGAQGEERIAPDELAAMTGTIPYEIMTGFHARLRRRFMP